MGGDALEQPGSSGVDVPVGFVHLRAHELEVMERSWCVGREEHRGRRREFIAREVVQHVLDLLYDRGGLLVDVRGPGGDGTEPLQQVFERVLHRCRHPFCQIPFSIPRPRLHRRPSPRVTGGTLRLLLYPSRARLVARDG